MWNYKFYQNNVIDVKEGSIYYTLTNSFNNKNFIQPINTSPYKKSDGLWKILPEDYLQADCGRQLPQYKRFLKFTIEIT